jgi:hypothetical protein
MSKNLKVKEAPNMIMKEATFLDYISLIGLLAILILVELFNSVFSPWHIIIYVVVFTMAVIWEKRLKQYVMKTSFRIKFATSVFLAVSLIFYYWIFTILKETQPYWYYVFSVALIVGLFLIWRKNLARKTIVWLGVDWGRHGIIGSLKLLSVLGLAFLLAVYILTQPANAVTEFLFSLPIAITALAATISPLIRKRQRRKESLNVIQKFGISAMILIFFSVVYYFWGKLEGATTLNDLQIIARNG